MMGRGSRASCRSSRKLTSGPSGWSTISARQLRTTSEGKGQRSLGSVLPFRQIPYLHPDHSLDLALRYVGRWLFLPVVSRANLGKLEGTISKEDNLAKYR